MPTKTFTDQRVLNVIDFFVKNKINGIETEADFLHPIGYLNVSNLILVKNGTNAFTAKQLQAIVNLYGVDANYLLNEKHLTMLYIGREVSPIIQIKQAVAALEHYMPVENTIRRIRKNS